MFLTWFYARVLGRKVALLTRHTFDVGLRCTSHMYAFTGRTSAVLHAKSLIKIMSRFTLAHPIVCCVTG
uniref:Uncharacterized protein n=1 Tax=Anguilla anguilla TaxID=7936 RepID=A0A0E9XRJ1_ANGAN